MYLGVWNYKFYYFSTDKQMVKIHLSIQDLYAQKLT